MPPISGGNKAVITTNRWGDQWANEFVKSGSRAAVIGGIWEQARGLLTPTEKAKLEIWDVEPCTAGRAKLRPPLWTAFRQW